MVGTLRRVKFGWRTLLWHSQNAGVVIDFAEEVSYPDVVYVISISNDGIVEVMTRFGVRFMTLQQLKTKTEVCKVV